jgi:hypothetical protein
LRLKFNWGLYNLVWDNNETVLWRSFEISTTYEELDLLPIYSIPKLCAYKQLILIGLANASLNLIQNPLVRFSFLRYRWSGPYPILTILFRPFVLLLLNTFKLLVFTIFWFWAYLMNVILESTKFGIYNFNICT